MRPGPPSRRRVLQSVFFTTTAARMCMKPFCWNACHCCLIRSKMPGPGSVLCSILLPCAAERHRAQKTQLGHSWDEADLLAVLQEQPQAGMVLTVEVVVDVPGQVSVNFVFRHGQPRRPLLRDDYETLGQQAMIAGLLKQLRQIHAFRRSIERIE